MDQIDVQTYKLHSEVYASHTIHRADRTERWTRVKKVGRGGFGRVYLERDMVGRFRAVKELSKEFNEAQRQDYLRELFAMAYFSKDQACFPYFRGWYEDRENIYIAMEYFELGDLLNCVPKPLSEAETRKIAFQLTEALAVLHSKNITHRDLKPENVFVFRKGPDWLVKLGDFGISKHVRDDDTSLHTQYLGRYVAPEILGLIDDDDEFEASYTNAVDIWSLGCLVYWLLEGSAPFRDPVILGRYCRGKITLPVPGMDAGLSEDGSTFLRHCLTASSKQRISASKALDLPWLKMAFDIVSDEESSLVAVSERHQGSRSNGTSPTQHSRAEATRIESQKAIEVESVTRQPFIGPLTPSTPMSPRSIPSPSPRLPNSAPDDPSRSQQLPSLTESSSQSVPSVPSQKPISPTRSSLSRIGTRDEPLGAAKSAQDPRRQVMNADIVSSSTEENDIAKEGVQIPDVHTTNELHEEDLIELGSTDSQISASQIVRESSLKDEGNVSGACNGCNTPLSSLKPPNKYSCINCGDTYCLECSSSWKSVALPHLGIIQRIKVDDNCYKRLHDKMKTGGPPLMSQTELNTPIASATRVEGENALSDTNAVVEDSKALEGLTQPISVELSHPVEKAATQDETQALIESLSKLKQTVNQTAKQALMESWSQVKDDDTQNEKHAFLQLVEAGYGFDSYGFDNKEALHWAAGEGNLKVIELILDYQDGGKRIDILAADGSTPLHRAVAKDQSKAASLLIKRGANVEERDNIGLTPLMRAAYHSAWRCIPILLKSGVDIEAKQQSSGYSALAIAAKEGHTGCMSYLITHGSANIETLNNRSRTPLGVAVLEGHHDAAALLLAEGAKTEGSSTSDDVLTPLSSLALAGKYIELAELLITAGADVNARRWDGQTPLMLAASEGHVDMIYLLKAKSADLHARDGFGRSALDMARQNGHRSVIELLNSGGAGGGGDANSIIRKGLTSLIKSIFK